ncbi:MAG: DUF502 domain-containing protein [Paracoccaceae bacterium]|nr:DUF502 domain-containing protein [Paracoccaceae bacterium]
MDIHKKNNMKRKNLSDNKNTFFQKTRNNFLTGLVLVVPVTLTGYLVWGALNFFDEKVIPLIPFIYNPETYLNQSIPGLGIFLFFIFTTIIGAITKGFFGRQIVKIGELLVAKTPIVRTIYNAVKQILETVLKKSNDSFQNACLIEYPRQGIWAVAFISTNTRGEIRQKINEKELVSVFLPTTPNPTSGFLLFVPKKDIVLLDMTVEEAAKTVISAGLVVPEDLSRTIDKDESDYKKKSKNLLNN